jgi:O-antigen ligase
LKKWVLNSIKINIALLGLSPILPRVVSAIAVGIFVLQSIYLFILSKNKFKKSKTLLINTSLYITYLFSLIYTSNFEYAYNHLMTALSLLVLPLAFYFLSLYKNVLISHLKNIFFKTFWIASVIYSLIICISFFTFSNPRYPFKDANFFRKASAGIVLIGQHPIYSSLILSLAFLIGVHFLFTENKRLKLTLIFGQVAILLILILLMSKGVLLALLVSLWSLFFFKFKDARGKNILQIVLIGIFLALFIISFIPQKNNRFSQLLNKETFTKLDENNSTGIRLAIYKCSFQSIKESPIFGYGFGDVRDKLLSCYVSRQVFMAKGNYNSHNQYLSIWLGMGLIGLLIFIYLIYFNLKITLKTSNFLGFSILLLFVVVMFFENILERQTGVVLFALLLNLFGFHSSSKLEKQN